MVYFNYCENLNWAAQNLQLGRICDPWIGHTCTRDLDNNVFSFLYKIKIKCNLFIFFNVAGHWYPFATHFLKLEVKDSAIHNMLFFSAVIGQNDFEMTKKNYVISIRISVHIG